MTISRRANFEHALAGWGFFAIALKVNRLLQYIASIYICLKILLELYVVC